MQLKKRPWPLYVLLLLLLFQAVSGLSGGLILMVQPLNGSFNIPLSSLQGSIFKSYLIPGLVLFFILGVFPLFTFSILWKQPDWKFLHYLNLYHDRYVAWEFSLFTGIGLIIFILVEVAAIGYGSVLQTIYPVVGLLIIIFTLTPAVMKYCERIDNMDE